MTLTEIVAIDALLADPAAYQGKTVRVEGMITDVCPKRGCWFDLAGTEPGVARAERDERRRQAQPQHLEDLQPPVVVGVGLELHARKERVVLVEEAVRRQVDGRIAASFSLE